MLYLLVSPNVFEKENGKIRKKEIRNKTIKDEKKTKKREQREREIQDTKRELSVQSNSWENE